MFIRRGTWPARPSVVGQSVAVMMFVSAWLTVTLADTEVFDAPAQLHCQSAMLLLPAPLLS